MEEPAHAVVSDVDDIIFGFADSMKVQTHGLASPNC